MKKVFPFIPLIGIPLVLFWRDGEVGIIKLWASVLSASIQALSIAYLLVSVSQW